MGFRKIVFAISLCFICSFSWAGVDFDGTDDSFSCGTAASIHDLGPLTFSLWTYFESFGGGNLGRIIQTAGSPNTGYRALYNRNNASDSTIQFGYDRVTTDMTKVALNGTITLNEWIHLLVTWDGTLGASGVKIYKNGAEVSYQSSTDGADALVSDSGQTLQVGNNTIDSTRGFDGKLNEIAIWNVALTSQEISTLALSRGKRIPLQIQPSALKAYWPFDDEEDGSSADADTFIDMSGNGNTCTGDNGANNTGLTATAEAVLSYP